MSIGFVKSQFSLATVATLIRILIATILIKVLSFVLFRPEYVAVLMKVSVLCKFELFLVTEKKKLLSIPTAPD